MTNPKGPVPEGASQAPGSPSPAASPSGDESETFDVPMSALGDVQEGAMVTCRVVSLDQQNGTATLALAQDEPEPAGGTDGMADEFKSASSAANSQPS